MNLHIKLKEGVIASKLLEYIISYVTNQNRSEDPKIRTWEVEVITLADKTRVHGMKNSGQFCENGWIRMSSYKGLIQADFIQNAKFDKTSDDQIAILLTRFASMLRNHFRQYIDTMTLYGL